ncbi:unannotated protein [freshwater metagenome]|uniref:L-threonylcarbamoyladenylate synthase n=1 Tax=freshwater metagenome TaxID=449393 RepID=A0A6J5ZS94_9ZZZZ|nr:threonylcarbamoyl-AMP synthase [Actinomycetota bacterium]MSW24630.1 threonylcarbamoyl-AMP synthase [Actinomycetota bacterium]MSX30315.1 threonylcarbamoyl-AMP synthase [Actinomycetota bacterium]MSX97399.1 threonylcarbamoyl-AMP synthase [Actinomycetota bacterium]MSZ79230.1 threonylcarbamoyl-AMP synthase [Actinomycetota bacterium]
MSETLLVSPPASGSDVQQAVAKAIAAISGGGLVVIPTDTSYAVVCDVFNSAAVTKLRMAKKQIAEIALPIAAASLDTIRGVANFSVLANDLASAMWPGALTILTIAQDSLSWSNGPMDSALAVRVPHHETALAVLAGVGPCVMTGTQQVGHGPVQTVEQARAQLGDLVDFYLDGGELAGGNSTVVDATTNNLRLIRAGVISLEHIRQVLPGVIDASATN